MDNKDFNIETEGSWEQRQCKRLNDENWELKMYTAQLENYIKFKGLKEKFEDWTTERRKK